MQANTLYRLLCLYACVHYYGDLFAQGYFDALRMEVKSDNIDVQMVCPGPIVSSISKNAFSSQLDKVPKFLFIEQVDIVLYSTLKM